MPQRVPLPESGDHQQLLNLQGGTLAERYHLDQTEHDSLVGSISSTVQTLRVAPWGQPTNNGQWGSPVDTIQAAINLANTLFIGQSVCIVVEPGTYNESVLASFAAGASPSYISLIGRASGETFISGAAGSPGLDVVFTDEGGIFLDHIIVLGNEALEPAIKVVANVADISKRWEARFHDVGAIDQAGGGAFKIGVPSDCLEGLVDHRFCTIHTFNGLALEFDTTGALNGRVEFAGDSTLFGGGIPPAVGTMPCIQGVSPTILVEMNYSESNVFADRPFQNLIDLDGNISAFFGSDCGIAFQGPGSHTAGDNAIKLRNGATFQAAFSAIGHGAGDYVADIGAGCGFMFGGITTVDQDLDNELLIDPAGFVYRFFNSQVIGPGPKSAAYVAGGTNFPGLDDQLYGGMRWTTAGRPAPAATEHPTGFNTDIGQMEYWDGAAWRHFGDTNVLFTPEGGIAVLVTNNTGAPSVKGTVLEASPTVDGGTQVSAVSALDPIGVAYDNGVPDGSQMWMVISGRCQVLLEDGTAATREYWAGTSNSQAGRATVNTAAPPGAVLQHFQELGHGSENVTAGINKLAFIWLHFN